MWFNFLSSSTSSSGSSPAVGGCADSGSWIMIGILFLLIVVWVLFSRRSQKKRQQEVQNTLDAIRPGNKVKTIGGICGIVVEVNNEDNTFILETGSETTGKCFMKFDKQAVYQTDAVAPTAQANAPAAPVDETVDAPVDETVDAPVDETAEESKEQQD